MLRTPRSSKVQAMADPTGDAARLSGCGRLRICSIVNLDEDAEGAEDAEDAEEPDCANGTDAKLSAHATQAVTKIVQRIVFPPLRPPLPLRSRLLPVRYHGMVRFVNFRPI